MPILNMEARTENIKITYRRNRQKEATMQHRNEHVYACADVHVMADGLAKEQSFSSSISLDV